MQISIVLSCIGNRSTAFCEVIKSNYSLTQLFSVEKGNKEIKKNFENGLKIKESSNRKVSCC